MVALMEQNSLYDRPDLYDLIAPSDPALECFYVATAGERGGRVLDLACGSGRLTIPLARSGLQVTGGDLSAKMLERARRSAEALTVELDLVQLDMRHFDLNGRTFDTIIVAMNSILHLHSLDDLSGFFRSVARHLSPKGRLVFDAFFPNVAMLSGDPDKRQLVGVIVHDTQGKIIVEENSQIRSPHPNQSRGLVLVDTGKEGFLEDTFADAEHLSTGDAVANSVGWFTPRRALW